ncbi:MAG: hypothetical protein WCF22_24895 [Candidatus Sulfotelmatobacter sp.]
MRLFLLSGEAERFAGLAVGLAARFDREDFFCTDFLGDLASVRRLVVDSVVDLFFDFVFFFALISASLPPQFIIRPGR